MRRIYFGVDLKLLDKQIKFVQKSKTKNQREIDLHNGLLDMLCDMYIMLQANNKLSVEVYIDD